MLSQYLHNALTRKAISKRSQQLGHSLLKAALLFVLVVLSALVLVEALLPLFDEVAAWRPAVGWAAESGAGTVGLLVLTGAAQSLRRPVH